MQQMDQGEKEGGGERARQWRQWNVLFTEMEQDISKLIGKLAEVPNIQKTTAVLVDEHQIKKQAGTSGSPFRWIYLDQLLGEWIYLRFCYKLANDYLF